MIIPRCKASWRLCPAGPTHYCGLEWGHGRVHVSTVDGSEHDMTGNAGLSIQAHEEACRLGVKVMSKS